MHRLLTHINVYDISILLNGSIKDYYGSPCAAKCLARDEANPFHSDTIIVSSAEISKNALEFELLFEQTQSAET